MSLIQGDTIILRSLLALGYKCGNFKMHWLSLEIQNSKTITLCLSFIQAHSPSQKTSFHVDVLNAANDAIPPQVQGQQMQIPQPMHHLHGVLSQLALIIFLTMVLWEIPAA